MSTLTPPRKPEPHECCGTGCIPCVMDIYEEELYEYEKALRQASTVGTASGAITVSGPVAQRETSGSDPV